MPPLGEVDDEMFRKILTELDEDSFQLEIAKAKSHADFEEFIPTLGADEGFIFGDPEGDQFEDMLHWLIFVARKKANASSCSGGEKPLCRNPDPADAATLKDSDTAAAAADTVPGEPTPTRAALEDAAKVCEAAALLDTIEKPGLSGRVDFPDEGARALDEVRAAYAAQATTGEVPQPVGRSDEKGTDAAEAEKEMGKGQKAIKAAAKSHVMRVAKAAAKARAKTGSASLDDVFAKQGGEDAPVHDQAGAAAKSAVEALKSSRSKQDENLQELNKFEEGKERRARLQAAQREAEAKSREAAAAAAAVTPTAKAKSAGRTPKARASTPSKRQENEKGSKKKDKKDKEKKDKQKKEKKDTKKDDKAKGKNKGGKQDPKKKGKK